MTLRFHKKIYPRKAVTEAENAFRDLATLQVRTDGDYTVVEFEIPDMTELAEFAGEFRNFVLGTTIAMRGER
jgi:hypothetical protein